MTEDNEFAFASDDDVLDLSPDHPALKHLQLEYLEKFKKASAELKERIRYILFYFS
jgi:hypothetical protein